MKNKYLLAVFVACVAIFFWRVFLRGLLPIPGDILLGTYYPWLNQKWGFPTGVAVKNPPMSDIVSLLYPWRLSAINYIKAFKLPLWDPASFFGMSLIGNFQAGIFNPFNLLFFLPLSFNYIWGFQVILQPLLAMVCMYLLLREWDLPTPAILLGSLAYGFSGQMIVWMEYNVHGFGMAVFPLMLFFLHKFLSKGGIKYLLAVSAIIAFVVFAGYPQYLYYYLLFGLIYILANPPLLKKELLKKILLFLFFSILGLGIAGVQILPGFESLSYSIKNIDSVALTNNVAYLPFKNLLMGLVPDFFGNPATYNYWGGGYYESFTFYSSLVALGLAAWSLGNKRRFNLVKVLFIFTILPFLFALPSPISSLIQNFGLPGLKGSVASRILFVYDFSAAALGAIGLENLIRLKKSGGFKRIEFRDFIVIFALTAVLGGAFALRLNLSLRNTIWPFLISALTLLAVTIYRKFGRELLLYIFSLILVIDMFRFGWKYLPFTKSDLIFPETPSLSYLMSQPKPLRVAIEPAEVLTANTWEPYGLESPSGYNIFLPRETASFLNFLNYGDLSSNSSRFIDIRNANSKLLDITNTKYLVFLTREKGVPKEAGSLPDTIERSRNYQKVYSEGAVTILKSPSAQERFYTVDKYRVIRSESEALKYLASNNFDSSSEVVLSEDPGVRSLTKCTIDQVSYNGQSMNLQSSCPGESILVVSNAYHLGWKALVNNQKTPTIKANDNFISILLPQGKSQINLYFEPDSFTSGLKISLASLLVMVLLGLKQLLNRRKSILHTNS